MKKQIKVTNTPTKSIVRVTRDGYPDGFYIQVKDKYTDNKMAVTRRELEQIVEQGRGVLEEVISLPKHSCDEMINNGEGDISYHDWNVKYREGCYCSWNTFLQ